MDKKIQVLQKRIINPQLPLTFIPTRKNINRPKFIILHDINCLGEINRDVYSNSNFNFGLLKIQNIIREKLTDINYHFVVDKIGRDYEVLIGRPINRFCYHPDIDLTYENSIHIMILWNMDIDIADMRFYRNLSYRCIIPIIRAYRMDTNLQNVIKLHRDVLKKNELKKTNCPGSFFSLNVLINIATKWL